MGVSVDERVVSMRFDNNQFINGIQQTLQAITTLKMALNFTGVAQGLQDVGNSLKDWSMDTLGNSVDAVAVKFRFLDTLAMNFFNRISDQIVSSAANMAKMATGIEGAMEGFSKYGEKTKAVQTILTAVQSKGYDLQDVNDILDDMNWFTDETSYNFTEMTNTIGKFTAAGVDLVEAKDAVQGIALWAAESGQNAQVASRAMYQLSQAYGTGTIKLQDWMSIEQANMSTEKIQNQLIEEGGKAAEAAVAKYGGFRASLQAGWLTTEVFTEVMKKYSEGVSEANWENGKFTGGVTELSKAAFAAAQEARTWTDVVDSLKDAVSTGWMHTWENIFGNKDEASEFFTTVANNLIAVSDYFTELRNNAIEAWYELGGRTDLIESLFSMWNTFGSIFGSMAQTIGDVIHPTQTLEEKMKSLFGISEEGDKIINQIKSTQTSISQLEDKISKYKKLMADGVITPRQIEELKAYEEELKKLRENSNLEELKAQLDQLDSGSGLLRATNKIKEFAEEFRKAFDPGQGSEYYNRILTSVDQLEKKIDHYRKLMADGVITPRQIEELKTYEEELKKLKSENDIKELMKQAKDAERAEANLEIINSVVRAVTVTVQTLWNVVTGFFRAIIPLFNPLVTIGKALASLFGSIGDFIVALMGVSEEGNKFYNVFKAIVDYILPPFTRLCEIVAGWLDELKEKIDELRKGIEEGNSPILDFIDKTKTALSPFIDLIKHFFDTVTTGSFTLNDAKEAVEGFFKAFMDNCGPLANVLQTAKEVIEGFFKALINTFTTTDGAEEGARRILSIAEILERAGTLIGQVSGGLISGIANIFEGIGKAFGKISLMKILGIIKGLAVTEGVLSIAGFLKELTATMQEIKDAFKILTGTFNPQNVLDVIKIFKAIGMAFLALAGALFIVSLIPTEQLKPTIAAISVILLELVGVFAIMALAGKKIAGTNGNPQAFDGVGDVFLSLALALIVIAFAVKMLGNMSVPELVKGITAVGLILIALAAVGKMFTTAFQSNSKGGLFKFLSFGGSEIGQKMMDGASGFVMLALAIRIIAGAVKLLGNLDQNQIEQGLLGFVVIIGALTAVYVAMSKFKVNGLNLIGIAFSMQMLGLALLEIAGVIAILGYMDTGKASQGIANFVTALAAISVAIGVLGKFVNGLNVIAISTGLILLGVAMGIFAAEIAVLGNLGIEKVMIGLFAIAGALTILGVAGALMLPVIPTLLLLSTAIIAISAGVLIASVGILALAGAFSVFGMTMDKYGSAIATGIIAVASSIAIAMPTFAKGLVNAIVTIIKGIGDASAEIVNSVVKLGMAILKGFQELVPEIGASFLTLLQTVLDVIVTMLPAIGNAGGDLLVALLRGIESHIGDIVVEAGMIIINFLNGIATLTPLIINAGMNLMVSFIEGMASAIVNNSERLLTALGSLVDALKIFFLTALNDLVGDIPVIGDKLGSLLETMKGDLNTGVTETTFKVAQEASGIPSSVAETIRANSTSGDLEAAGGELIGKVVSGFNGELGSTNLTEGATSLVGNFVSSIGGDINLETLQAGGGGMLNNFLSGMTNEVSAENMTLTTNTLVDNYISGFADREDDVKESGEKTALAGNEGAAEQESEFETTGFNLASGIANGLSSSAAIQKVCEAARALVRAAIEAANDEGGIESPSKETYQTGKFLVLGAVNAVKDYSFKLEKSARDMSDKAMTAMSNSLLSIYDLNDDLAMRSTIRPVLDLTNVKAGSSSIESMLSTSSIKDLAEASIGIDMQGDKIDNLVSIANDIFKQIQNGSDVYLDGGVIAGHVNRRLGVL